MTHEKILNLAFFQYSEEPTGDHRATYNEARTHIVDYAHSSLYWGERHTGLTIVKAELTIMIELANSANIPYAKGLLHIVEGMLRKLELTAPTTIANTVDEETPKQQSEEFQFASEKIFTNDKCDLCELISLVLKAVYPNGCSLKEKQYIIKGMHLMLGWKYDTKKWQNGIDGIRKRTPDGISVTYYLDRIVNQLNDELAA